MKWIGALLFIGTTTLVGFEWSNRLAKRPRHIRQLINALQILEAEMLYSQMPLKDAFAIIAKQIPFPTNLFFQTLANTMHHNVNNLLTIWEEAIQVLMEKSCLSKSEAEILYQFGRTLGQHDFTQQQKHIQLTIHHLERELQDAREEQQRYSKMAKSLGVLCGVFIVLLLI